MASSVDDQYDYSWKVVVVVGDSGVGKTNLAARFTRNEFNFNKQTTIGVEFFTRSTTIDGKMVIAHIWDTAGMDRYRATTSAYYRGVVGVMVVYDLTTPQSFQNLGKWLEEMKEHTGSSVCIMLVGNKTDLGHLRAVTMEEGRSLAEKMNFSFAETSALDTTNVEEAFSHLLVDIFKTQVEEQGEPPSTPVTNANDGLNVPDNPSTPDSDGQEGMGSTTMGAEQSKVINRTGDTVHILVFKDSDRHWFQDIRQPPSDGRPIDLSLDGSNHGGPVRVGVIHNEIGGRYVFDLFRLTAGATLIVKKVTKNSGVQGYERSNGIELLSLGRTISTLACRPDWLLRGQSKSSGPPPATAEVSTVGSSNQQQADQQSGHPPRTDD